MALQNRDELRQVLADDSRLGRVFARHAYGMRAWVDLFSARIAGIDDPRLKALVAMVVGDNARHMILFRERAAAHGVDPDAYRAPGEGDAIYDRLDELSSFGEVLGYALGSLDHFADLLAVYAEAARDPDDLEVIHQVAADNDRTRRTLRGLVGPDGERLAEEAHELYRVRELAETPRYLRDDDD
jgi:PAS domain-containing protein